MRGCTGDNMLYESYFEWLCDTSLVILWSIICVKIFGLVNEFCLLFKLLWRIHEVPQLSFDEHRLNKKICTWRSTLVLIRHGTFIVHVMFCRKLSRGCSSVHTPVIRSKLNDNKTTQIAVCGKKISKTKRRGGQKNKNKKAEVSRANIGYELS